MIKLIKGDCLQVMDELIEQGVKVDLILTDPPYGTTACKWDSVIPLDEMWKRLNKLTKDSKTPIVLFGGMPFTAQLVSSNIKKFKYCLTWDKMRGGGFLNAKHKPLPQTEDIVVFQNGTGSINYYPQMVKLEKPKYKSVTAWSPSENYMTTKLKVGSLDKKMVTHRYPTSILSFKKVNSGSLHPTQKPVDLLEYLIKTYSNEGDTVLDFTMGSGSTGVACKNLNRNFIGIELDENYYNIAKERIDNVRK